MKSRIAIKMISSALTVFMVLLILPITTSAASYPLVVATTTGSSYTIPQGETGTIKLMVLPEYKNEQYHVNLYNSSGTLIGSVESTYYNSGSDYIRYFTITVDTKKLEMGVGRYTAKYWMSFYSLYSWHDAPNTYSHSFEVIPNVCNGNHNIVFDSYLTEGTCSKAGTAKMRCTKCKYYYYEEKYGEHTYGEWSQLDENAHQRICTACENVETESHVWDAGVVTRQPSCGEDGVKKYTCSVCGGTKNEAIAKTSDHNYSDWVKYDNNVHKRTCSRCGAVETQSHKWDGGTITTKPTCAKSGIKTYICSVCGVSKTETVARTTTHNYATATKVDDDKHIHSCVDCGKTETVAHVWDKTTFTVWPTSNEKGVCEQICTACGAVKTSITGEMIVGDINCDYAVNNKDLTRLFQYLSDWDVEVNPNSLDLNGDGKINNKDLTRFFQYLSDWDVEIF